MRGLTFTAWQLTAGGLLLLPVAFLVEPALPPLDTAAVFGCVWHELIGAAFTYFLWFQGIAQFKPATVAPLGLLSPVAATLLGLANLGETLRVVQTARMVLVPTSVCFAQCAQLHAAAQVATRA